MHKNSNLLLNYLEKKFNKSVVSSKPWKFYIEVSLSCNLRCITCGHSFTPYSGLMKDNVFEAIKPLFNHARVIHEVGYGEPLIEKKFLDKLQYFKGMGAYVDIYTNGMLLNRFISERMTSLALDQITFSIDGGTKQTHEGIRRGSDYSEILENIRGLHQIKMSQGRDKPHLRVNYVGMKRNIEELPLAIRTLAEVGIKEVVLSDMVPPNAELARECLFYHADMANRAINEAAENARACQITFIVPSTFQEPYHLMESNDHVSGLSMDNNIPVGETQPNPITPDAQKMPSAEGKNLEYEKYPCFEPWQSLYITHDGNIRPCCGLTEPFGNIMKDSIENIWNNDRYRLLRKTVNSTHPAYEGCRICMLRRRVRFSWKNAVQLSYASLKNNGILHTAKKAAKYVIEYL